VSLARDATAPTPRGKHVALVWTGLAVTYAMVIANIALARANGEPLLDSATYLLAFSLFALVGAFILSRDPRNRIGWFMFGSAIVTIGLAGLCSELFTWSYQRTGASGMTQAFGILNTYGWVFGLLPVVIVFPLLLPDGQLPSRRWRPYVASVLALLVVAAVYVTFTSATVSGSGDATVPNPLYLIRGAPVIDPFFAVAFPLAVAIAVWSVVRRFRRSSGQERQQIKWIAFGMLVVGVGIVVSGWMPDPIGSVLGGLSFAILPISIGVAVLRYRLYDLDLVVRKTVLYAALALFATLVYVAVVALVGSWLGRDSSFLTMIAAVIVAVTFQPVRSRLARLADRVVYGERATPYEVLSEFGERVGATYAADDVLARMARVLGEGVAAARSTVWLRVGDEDRPIATWTAPDTAEPALTTEHRVDVVHSGEVLGALTVSMPQNDPIDPGRQRLVADLAAQAALVLRNVRLTEDLRARLEDLKAAQKRLVSAQDHERRRLERNIHDGAQQQLVALTVKLRLAQGLATKDGARTADMLEQLQSDTTSALEDLRDLARGIYPPLLADQGLPAALEAQARRSVVPIELDIDGVRRYPAEVEAAVYFSILEAVQNVAKYAEATSVRIELRDGDGALRFLVRDDGRGFDASDRTYGSGLQGIADRLEALDGAMDVRSAPGEGTQVRGSVPVETAPTPEPSAKAQPSRTRSDAGSPRSH
jgi:signal transduction histidine kinase